MGHAIKHTSRVVAKQAGEIARLKVVKGPDFGSTFVLLSPVISVGRGDENDVVLSDLKTSRKHIQISRDESSQSWNVKDQGSVNGILLNGEIAKEGILREGSLVALGETLLEFSIAESGTMVMTAPARTLGPAQTKHYLYGSSGTQTMIQAGIRQAPAVAAVESVNTGEGPAEIQQFNKKSIMPMLMIAVGLYGAYELGYLNDILGITPPKKKKVDILAKKNTTSKVARDLASYLPKDSLNRNKEAQSLFRSGFREYREGNFLRAKTLFETALQIAPGNMEYIQYLELSEREIYKSVDLTQKAARHDFELGRYVKARSEYETVMRLLFQTPDDPAYQDAKAQIEVLDKLKKEASL